MRIIKLDASNWTNILDFYFELLVSLGAPAGHGYSIDALVDSMIWGRMNEVTPPYTIQIVNIKSMSTDLIDEIRFTSQILSEARKEFRARREEDVDVKLEVLDFTSKLTPEAFEEIDKRLRNEGKPNPASAGVNLRIGQAWIQAADDLGLEVISPFRLVGKDGTVYWYEAFIAAFGRPKGTIVGNMSVSTNDSRAEQGFYSPLLSPSYEIYERKHFIDTLNDWGWFGEKGKEPTWYTGEPWS